MFERFDHLVAYVGSAAVVAFLAACLTSPQVATFQCDTDGAQHCELIETMSAAVPEAGAIIVDAASREPVALAEAN